MRLSLPSATILKVQLYLPKACVARLHANLVKNALLGYRLLTEHITGKTL